MRIAQVVGAVTLSRAHPNVQGFSLRLVQPWSLADAVAETSSPEADLIAMVDLCGTGQGDRVLLAEGPEAAQPFHPQRVPVDAYCAARLDQLQIDCELVASYRRAKP